MDQTSLSPLWQSPTRRDGFSIRAKPALPSGGVDLCSRMPRRPMWVVDYPVPRDVPLDRASVWRLLPLDLPACGAVLPCRLRRATPYMMASLACLTLNIARKCWVEHKGASQALLYNFGPNIEIANVTRSNNATIGIRLYRLATNPTAFDEVFHEC